MKTGIIGNDSRASRIPLWIEGRKHCERVLFHAPIETNNKAGTVAPTRRGNSDALERFSIVLVLRLVALNLISNKDSDIAQNTRLNPQSLVINPILL